MSETNEQPKPVPNYCAAHIKHLAGECPHLDAQEFCDHKSASDASADMLHRELVNMLSQWPIRNEFWLRTQGSLSPDGTITYGLGTYEITVRRKA